MGPSSAVTPISCDEKENPQMVIDLPDLRDETVAPDTGGETRSSS